MELAVVDVFMEGGIPQQVVAGGPEAVQQPQFRVLEAFAVLQKSAQMVDEHGSGFCFREEVQLLLEHIVPGLPQRTKQPFVLDRLQELSHPLEILIGGFRQEEKAHPAESAKGPDEEAVFRFGVEVVVECSDVIQDLR